MADYFLRDLAGESGGDGESDAGVEAADHGVDTDNLAINVDEGAAAVAGVNGGVGLDEILIEGRVVDEPVAALGAYVADGEGVVETIGGSDGDGEFTDADVGGLGELGGAQVFGVDFNDSKVGLGVDATEAGGVFAAIGGDDLETCGVLDNMAVGEDVAVGSYNNA